MIKVALVNKLVARIEYKIIFLVIHESKMVTASATRLGDFWKFLATNSPSKVAQKDC